MKEFPKRFEAYHHFSVDQTFSVLLTGPKGLTEAEAQKRLVRYGPNEIREREAFPNLRLFFRQFRNFLVVILGMAAGLSYVLGRELDAVLIIAILIINACLGFFEERKTRRAIRALKNILIPLAWVVQGGRPISTEVRGLVPGDVVILRAGDVVPCDARLFEARGLQVSEALLTGESLPVAKNTNALDAEVPMAERTNMVFAGTSVMFGEARAVCVATGEGSVLGELTVAMTRVKEPVTFFERAVRTLGVQMSLISFVGAGLVFLVGYLLRSYEFFEIFLFAVASLVSGIPEGLPAVLTIVLAVSAEHMARRKAVVRELPAVQTLGVATVILTDKTGTLTENLLTVKAVTLAPQRRLEVGGSGLSLAGDFIENGERVDPRADKHLMRLLKIGAVCNSAELVRRGGELESVGDITETALIVAAEKAGLSKAVADQEEGVLDELPFHEDHKYRAVTVSARDGEMFVVGACEKILVLSDHYLDGSTVVPMTMENREKLHGEIEIMAEKGMRVLGAAFRPYKRSGVAFSHEDVGGLVFVGLFGEKDSLRPDTREAVLLARRLGLSVVMVTGDHQATAVSIARESGLLDGNEKTEGKCLSERELQNMTDQELSRKCPEIKIFARVTPTSKLRILRAWQARGEIVAMTGDGVNDATALKAANIGIAMGKRGTDVAREASGIVLMDDNFSTIIAAIEEGRVVFRNVRSVSSYLVTTSVAEFGTILATILLGFPLPLLPLHILWLNLITDGIGGLPLSFERSHEADFRARVSRNEKLLSKEIIPFVLISALFMVTGTVALYSFVLPMGLNRARTMAFTAMALFQLWNMWNMRSLKRPIAEIGFFSNRTATYAFLGAILLQVLLVSVPWSAKLFSFEALSVLDWILILIATSSVFFAGELYKYVRNFLRTKNQ